MLVQLVHWHARSRRDEDEQVRHSTGQPFGGHVGLALAADARHIRKGATTRWIKRPEWRDCRQTNITGTHASHFPASLVLSFWPSGCTHVLRGGRRRRRVSQIEMAGDDGHHLFWCSSRQERLTNLLLAIKKRTVPLSGRASYV